MSESSNFFGQPIYGQLRKSLDREKIVEISRKHGGEKYVKSFDGYTHLLTNIQNISPTSTFHEVGLTNFWFSGRQ